MAEKNFPDNTIYELDNMIVLRGMNPETVNLIGINPPFNTRWNQTNAAGFYADRQRWRETGGRIRQTLSPGASARLN